MPGPQQPKSHLRCRLCSKVLIPSPASEIVPHKPGPGQIAFEPRKRDPRWYMLPTPGGSTSRNGAHSAAEQAEDSNRDDLPASKVTGEGQILPAPSSVAPHASSPAGPASTVVRPTNSTSSAATTTTAPATTFTPASPPPMQTAASLTARLPPHLAALRRGMPPAGLNVQASQQTQHQQCSSYFVEPQPWMEPSLETGEVRGRLECPNNRCSGKLGNWDWAGAQCACGAWVTPAFALHASRVDAV
ncbi:tyrosine protein phosphatase yvh1 [Tilletia horrida]|nr:tyrosine protein phosphatase yvh1 [Tilletia horrida]